MSEGSQGMGLVFTETLGSHENMKAILSTSEPAKKSPGAQTVRSSISP